MTSSDLWDQATAERYDEGAAEMFEPAVLDPAVDFLARLAGDGPALELAIGTGRVAVPLAARGVPVSGIELSEPMVAELRRKVDATAVPVVVGDMATTRMPGEFALVYLVFNTIGNLRTQAEQVAYAWPAELDLMAQLAGMELEQRVADWDGSQVTADSESHVSVWRTPL